MKKKLFLIPILIIILLLSFSLVCCCKQANTTTKSQAKTSTISETIATIESTATATEIETTLTQEQQHVIYRNTQYGFSFSLPLSWEGYQIIESKWEGYTPGSQGDVTVEQGPIISIRHPKWTSANPRQDIPIMIFTLAQWDSLQQDKFHIGAAPIGPSELGSNTKYVFALPARYNFSFPTGYEEVEKILEGNPLKAF